MKSLTKFEAIGIFGSIVIMAVALFMLRTDSSPKDLVSSIQLSDKADVVVADDTEDEQEGLINAILDASSADGNLLDVVIDDAKIGEGDPVKEGDTVEVHYIGATRDGVQFDSSYERNQPFTFTLGEGKVIPGWEVGLLGMKVGGQRIVVIPPEMAYGNRQIGQIKPNSTLVFAVELLAIR